MKNITCPTCNAYLGLGATAAPNCPKCGNPLSGATEAGPANKPSMLFGCMLGALVLVILFASIGTVIMIAPRFVDAAIPGIIGLWLVIWPESFFIVEIYGEGKRPDAAKIGKLRGSGLVGLFIAVVYALIKLSGH